VLRNGHDRFQLILDTPLVVKLSFQTSRMGIFRRCYTICRLDTVVVSYKFDLISKSCTQKLPFPTHFDLSWIRYWSYRWNPHMFRRVTFRIFCDMQHVHIYLQLSLIYEPLHGTDLLKNRLKFHKFLFILGAPLVKLDSAPYIQKVHLP
jgi:hypothetical protein